MGTAKKARLAGLTSQADFEPEDIDLEQVFTNAQVLNPGMVAFRVAVTTLNKTQEELTSVVEGLRADALEEMVELLVDAHQMFDAIQAACAEAERRIETCMAMRDGLDGVHDGAVRR